MYVIAEPCIDVKDKACIEECAVECICDGERMLSIHPDKCADWGAREPVRAVEAILIRWRRPSPGDGEQIADVLGILEENDSTSFAVRTSDGALVVIPAARALAGKVVPPAPQNRRRAGPTSL